ncbi:MAG TPA: tRNA pseudouridine(38-40) synthase TruA [Anaeromyxobacteraceae bacterium]|nr:tRNA pseudouridine(38-40) synthase TruA [Anaeromyxobacteraceae bacterium]
MEKRRYAMRLMYDGGAFRGFQAQPGLPTVQGALDAALQTVGVSTRLDVAARTDAGVHALDQVVSFWARRELDPAALRAAVNAATPAALTCLDAARVPPSFHARGSALSRTYVYLVGAPASPELEGRAWSLPDPRAFADVQEPRLDAERMREALESAVGSHDFRGFARPGEQRGTVRTISRASVVAAPWAPLVLVELEGRGFLRAMVRNLVGTAVEIGLGLAAPSRVAEILQTGARYRGVRAPGWGLTLTSVRYDPSPFSERPTTD